METFEPLLKTEQAASLLGLHPKTLQKLARQGKVPATRIGDLWRFRAGTRGCEMRYPRRRHSCREERKEGNRCLRAHVIRLEV